MNIAMIGTGYVGLVTGACLADLGNTVTCVDIDTEKIKKINDGIAPIYEDGLTNLLKKNKERIQATTSYEEAIDASDITFVCVGTPPKQNGSIDLTQIIDAITAIGKEIKKKKEYHSVVIKSTVIPGTTNNMIKPLLEKTTRKKIGHEIGLGMNPEFLREGSAIHDFSYPDRIINGCSDRKTREALQKIYAPFTCPIIETDTTTAEMIKYASNSFLATKISYINEIGNVCKQLGINVYDVADGMGLDKRIERSFLNAGIGWGGSCFGKDTRALRYWGMKNHSELPIIDGTIRTNETQHQKIINILKKKETFKKEQTVGILGLAFKPKTDDIRDSRSIPLIQSLLAENIQVYAYDPKAMDQFKKHFPDITYCACAQDVLDKTNHIIIATAWDEFKAVDYSKHCVIDGRYLPEIRTKAKDYEGIGW